MKSRKTDKEHVYVEISFEHMMSLLFGEENYHGYAGSVDAKTWKKDMLKIAKYIKKSIELNHNGDWYHRNKLTTMSDTMIKEIEKSKAIKDINVNLIETLTKLVFVLLGKMPNHWDLRRPFLDKYWTLSDHRTLNYTQSIEQKAYMIIYLTDIQKKFSVDLEGYRNMRRLFDSRKFKGDHSNFVLWFKNKYPEKYCEIF